MVHCMGLIFLLIAHLCMFAMDTDQPAGLGISTNASVSHNEEAMVQSILHRSDESSQQGIAVDLDDVSIHNEAVDRFRLRVLQRLPARSRHMPAALRDEFIQESIKERPEQSHRLFEVGVDDVAQASDRVAAAMISTLSKENSWFGEELSSEKARAKAQGICSNIFFTATIFALITAQALFALLPALTS